MNARLNPKSALTLPVETGWVLAEGSPNRSTSFLHMLAKLSPIGRILLAARMARDEWILLKNCVYDFNRVRRYSSAVRTGDSREKLAALITMAYHGIEKGLSLPNPRPGFGVELSTVLLSRLERYVPRFGCDEMISAAIQTLEAYFAFNSGLDHSICDLSHHRHRLSKLISAIPAENYVAGTGGVKRVTRGEFLRHARMDLSSFFASRSSVRTFVNKPVTRADIEHAVDLARNAPSCCNRQSSRVWWLQSEELISKAIEIQGGARGFSQEIKSLLVVTADLAAFQSSGERYQSWIDGSLFAMSLVYALHSLGIVSCMLNWSQRKETDCEFRAVVGIPPSQTIVLLVAVGYPKEEFNVPVSQRRSVSSILVIR